VPEEAKKGRPVKDPEVGAYTAYYVRKDVGDFILWFAKSKEISRSKALSILIRCSEEYMLWKGEAGAVKLEPLAGEAVVQPD
jgi:hypothetical protein